MAKTTKSQWEFADLLAASPPVPAARKVWSVAGLTARVRSVLEKEFTPVWVTGEVSNLRAQPSGHLYFVIKDTDAQLSCVVFRGQGGPDRDRLKDGMQVTLCGDLTVYETRGQYQLRVSAVELQGAGALQAAFERLKARLAAEGLFDPGRKRPLPRYPRRVGVVTSPATAALRDVIHVLSRRSGAIELVLAPCRVQGSGAAEEIAAAIARLNAWSPPDAPLDLILLTRGGGSIEDIWCFNEELVARAIASSALPVLSAVGHEIDFTIADFASDLRAATPSAAAELLTEGYMAAAELTGRCQRRLNQLVRTQYLLKAGAWSTSQRRLTRGHPRRALEARAQDWDGLASRLGETTLEAVATRRAALESWLRRWMAVRPRSTADRLKVSWMELHRRQLASWEQSMASHRSEVRRLQEKLGILSPQSVLERGYSITRDESTGHVIRSAEGLGAGRRMVTRLSQGEITSVVI